MRAVWSSIMIRINFRVECALAELSQCDARACHITCNTPTLSSSFILALKWKLLTPIVTMIKGLRLFCLQFLKLSIIYRVFNVPLTLIIMGDAPCLAPTTLPRSWCQWVSHILYFYCRKNRDSLELLIKSITIRCSSLLNLVTETTAALIIWSLKRHSYLERQITF